MASKVAGALLSALGGAAGGAIGYVAFGWLLREQGFYAMLIPGALLGVGASLFAPDRSKARGVACGLAALALGLYTEWAFRPFNADQSLRYFLAHLGDLLAVAKVMIVAGAGLAYWIGKDPGFLAPARPAKGPSPDQP